ncbi:34023_t:CDS:1 [Gigaspora margarita]|uniref:34023_t:CDS:1 n=1 Tax=Gigaspora margarita TaxID=4874 RepID=A0ABN7UNW5_GIGMA|nr:34023_t:CDS:1 [Gigaspora margarita]
MTCLLGRIPVSNPYTTYRFLQDDFFLSKNTHTLELYSGMIGAFLNLNEPTNWYHKALSSASNWLKKNIPIFYQYKNLSIITLPNSTNSLPIPFSSARQFTGNSNPISI